MVVPHLHPEQLDFPPTTEVLGEDGGAAGLLAIGGDLSVARLRAAYQRGIFPWFSPGQPILWWSLAPRMVLQTRDFKLHRSLRKTLARFIQEATQLHPRCEVVFDRNTPAVIAACADRPREGQPGTWIVPEMVAAYSAWHHAGDVHSVETWIDGELVGGLYCVHLGGMVYGESMFARRSDASKIAMAALVAFCRLKGIDWIDCQQQTGHLASLGAAPVARADFEAHLRRVTAPEAMKAAARWQFEPAMWQALS